MKILFDDDLVEAVVNLVLAGIFQKVHPMQLRRFRFERDRIYSIQDGDDRNEAFAKLHLKWFHEWSCDALINAVASDLPQMSRMLGRLVCRKAQHVREEGAELFVSEQTGRNGVLAICTATFHDTTRLQRFLYHELMHLEDLVDPAFEFNKDVDFHLMDASQMKLAQSRYRLLWSISIDARLIARAKPHGATRQERWRQFERMFHFLPGERQGEIFNALWNSKPPKHEQLIHWSVDPREVGQECGPVPGGSCPLCTFATFEWKPVDSLSPSSMQRIRRDFPSWLPESGICARCAEIYEAENMHHPPTLYLG
jgi:hypothetical protein